MKYYKSALELEAEIARVKREIDHDAKCIEELINEITLQQAQLRYMRNCLVRDRAELRRLTDQMVNFF